MVWRKYVSLVMGGDCLWVGIKLWWSDFFNYNRMIQTFLKEFKNNKL